MLGGLNKRSNFFSSHQIITKVSSLDDITISMLSSTQLNVKALSDICGNPAYWDIFLKRVDDIIYWPRIFERIINIER